MRSSKGKARGSIHSRLQSLEARIPERPSASEARKRIGDFLGRLVAWRQAGSPDTEEGRELQVISEAFQRIQRGDRLWHVVAVSAPMVAAAEHRLSVAASIASTTILTTRTLGAAVTPRAVSVAAVAVPSEELADKVLSGEVERGVGAVAGQLLNGARACVRDGLAAREQEELVARLQALEEALETKAGNGGRRWGA